MEFSPIEELDRAESLEQDRWITVADKLVPGQHSRPGSKVRPADRRDAFRCTGCSLEFVACSDRVRDERRSTCPWWDLADPVVSDF